MAKLKVAQGQLYMDEYKSQVLHTQISRGYRVSEVYIVYIHGSWLPYVL